MDESTQVSELNPQEQPSLKRRALQGSIWTFAGYGANQVIRLGSNLILTRLLFPEVFGLMALAQTFLTALEMFSDVGININIIQNKQGEDLAFLNTAWTVQVFRGLLIWFVACLIAYPVSQFYQETLLMYLLPVSGATAFISGLNSTKLATTNRKIDLGRLTLIELGSQLIGTFSMLLGAWALRSVWALVIGGLIGSLIKMIASHLFLEGESNHFEWNKDAAVEIYRFGRWVFLSTILTFLALQGDRLVLGRIFDIRLLGIYTIALTLSQVSMNLISQVEGKVLIPSYSETLRERPEKMRSVLAKTRLIAMGFGWSIIIPIIIFGTPLINFLYDNRYAEAGWILQVLSIGALIELLLSSYDGVLMAQGAVRLNTFLVAFAILVKFSAILVGYHLMGPQGAIIGVAVSPWFFYPFLAIIVHRVSLWQPKIDLLFLTSGTLIASIFYFMP